MLPLVLGGIALAAVGYGVKELCESEGCPWDDEVDYRPSTPVNTFEALHKKKVELHENKLLKLRVLLLKIENVDEKLQFKNRVQIVEEKLAQDELEEDVYLYTSMYSKTIDASAILVDNCTYALELLLDKETHYKHLDKSEKKFITQAYKVVNRVQKLIGLRLLDNKVLNLKTITTLKTLQTKLTGV